MITFRLCISGRTVTEETLCPRCILLNHVTLICPIIGDVNLDHSIKAVTVRFSLAKVPLYSFIVFFFFISFNYQILAKLKPGRFSKKTNFRLVSKTIGVESVYVMHDFCAHMYFYILAQK